MDELYRKLLAQLEEGQDTVLAFITEGDGSIPRTTGAYMLVGREGRIFGTIGGGNLEYQAVLHAQCPCSPQYSFQCECCLRDIHHLR